VARTHSAIYEPIGVGSNPQPPPGGRGREHDRSREAAARLRPVTSQVGKLSRVGDNGIQLPLGDPRLSRPLKNRARVASEFLEADASIQYYVIPEKPCVSFALTFDVIRRLPCLMIHQGDSEPVLCRTTIHLACLDQVLDVHIRVRKRIAAEDNVRTVAHQSGCTSPDNREVNVR
jgi:hypothetical protein